MSLLDSKIVKNNAIAFASRRIPYIPELRHYCESLTSCILMTQLEYWFASMPDGFYKFQSPCVQHPAYKARDSWVEELSFSEREFRSAFDNIGIRYRSKGQLHDVINKGEDPFAGKGYLSYIDVRNGLTYYHRNHDVISTIINHALNNYYPESPQEPAQTMTEPAELTITPPQSLRCVSSGDNKSVSPLIRLHKITTKENNNSSKTSECSVANRATNASSPIAAAQLSNEDRIIQKQLTKTQLRYVELLVQEFGEKLCVAKPELTMQVIETITNPAYFKEASNDFLKKYNTLRKVIREGKWAPPVSIAQAADVEAKRAKVNLEVQIREAASEITHAMRAIDYSSDDGAKANWQMIEKAAREKLEKLNREFAKYSGELSVMKVA